MANCFKTKLQFLHCVADKYLMKTSYLMPLTSHLCCYWEVLNIVYCSGISGLQCRKSWQVSVQFMEKNAFKSTKLWVETLIIFTLILIKNACSSVKWSPTVYLHSLATSLPKAGMYPAGLMVEDSCLTLHIHTLLLSPKFILCCAAKCCTVVNSWEKAALQC